MLKRLLVGLLPIFAVVMASAQGPAPPVRCDCCARKPQIIDSVYSTFAGPVAVITQMEDTFNGSNTQPWKNRVVMIWDLTNHSGAPLDTWWTTTSIPKTTPYSHVDWTDAKLGEVFGVTLDGLGNIYVAATRIYGSNKVGSLTTGTNAAKAGQIYRLANGTGAPSAFGSPLPQGSAGEGIGNIYYDCEYNSLYATNFFNGLIHRLSAAGLQQPNAWDHGLNLPTAVGPTGIPLGRPAILGFDGTSSYAKLGRRPVAVHVYKGWLYYSIWSQDWYRLTPGTSVAGSHGTTPTEIWSVALDANGDPMPPARLVATLPPYSSTFSFTNPVTDITFGRMGTMFVAERTMQGNNAPYAHSSHLREYSWNGSVWVLSNPTAYEVGSVAWGPLHTNAAGGVAFDFGPGGRVWATGDALHWVPPYLDYVYGIQGMNPGGGTNVNSVLIDANDYIGAHNKTQIGDVEIPCPNCATPTAVPSISGPQTKCVSPSTYSVTPQAGVTYTWTVSGGTPISGTGPSISVNWTGTGTGSVTVTATGSGACGPVTSVLSVAACDINCEYCSQFRTTVDMTAPTALGGGLHTVTPIVTSNMPGVTSVTVTLLNASVSYSNPSCGVSGPLPAYIPSAGASSVPALNPPFLPVPNGNQAIWDSTPVNLSGGVTTPFQLQLPVPPPLSDPLCSATFSFCIRVSLRDEACRSCDVIRCFGSFFYATGLATESPATAR